MQPKDYAFWESYFVNSLSKLDTTRNYEAEYKQCKPSEWPP